jgi:hypothetical protein
MITLKFRLPSRKSRLPSRKCTKKALFLAVYYGLLLIITSYYVLFHIFAYFLALLSTNMLYFVQISPKKNFHIEENIFFGCTLCNINNVFGMNTQKNRQVVLCRIANICLYYFPFASFFIDMRIGTLCCGERRGCNTTNI